MDKHGQKKTLCYSENSSIFVPLITNVIIRNEEINIYAVSFCSSLVYVCNDNIMQQWWRWHAINEFWYSNLRMLTNGLVLKTDNFLTLQNRAKKLDFMPCFHKNRIFARSSEPPPHGIWYHFALGSGPYRTVIWVISRCDMSHIPA